MLKKIFTLLQLLACSSLIASELTAASQNMNAADPCKKECKPECCPPLPCPCFEQGDEMLEAMPMPCKYPAAYNHPANIHIDACWDLYADISYIYWYTGEEGLCLATTGYNIGDSYVEPSIENGYAVFQDFDYTSGFKVGLGANLNVDDWVADLEYTYLRQNTSVSSGTAPASSVGRGVFALTGWYYQNYYGYTLIAPHFDSKWKMGLDWLDLTFKRPYYQGRRLVITPSAGLRASWIRQTLEINAYDSSIAYDGAVTGPGPNLSKNQSNSWAIGPRALVDAHWIVGAGFRFQGNMGGSLLFTQFTKVSHRETGAYFDGGQFPAHFKLTNYNCLRPMMEANLGIGWGSYFSDLAYHLDLSATYDFNYLWGQNMMKFIAEINNLGNAGHASDLMLHGLNLKARFDF